MSGHMQDARTVQPLSFSSVAFAPVSTSCASSLSSPCSAFASAAVPASGVNVRATAVQVARAVRAGPARRQGRPEALAVGLSGEVARPTKGEGRELLRYRSEFIKERLVLGVNTATLPAIASSTRPLYCSTAVSPSALARGLGTASENDASP
jgi:hypothetical protein